VSVSSTQKHVESALSALLAAAICMAITQVIGLAAHLGSIPTVLLLGLSLSSIAFGGTYAGVFFASLATARRQRTNPVAAD
jgi:hypothetical protein